MTGRKSNVYNYPSGHTVYVQALPFAPEEAIEGFYVQIERYDGAVNRYILCGNARRMR